MTPEEIRAAASEWYQRCFNDKDMTWTRDSLRDDFEELGQVPPGMPPGKDGVLAWFGAMNEAFPDLHADIVDTIVDGNRIAVRGRMSGTMQGELMGMPATGKPFSVVSIDIVDYDDEGKVAAHWGVTDQAGMMMQLGLVPGA